MAVARLNCHRTFSAMRASLSMLSFGRSSPFGVASISILRTNQCQPPRPWPPRRRSSFTSVAVMEKPEQLAIVYTAKSKFGYPPSRFRGIDTSGLPCSWTTSSVPPLGVRVRLASPLSQAKVLPPSAVTVDRRSSL